MNSKLTDIEVLLDKINRLFRNFRNEDPTVNKVELELFKDYTRQLYDKLWEYELSKSSSENRQPVKNDTILPKEEKPEKIQKEEPVIVKMAEPEKQEPKREEPVLSVKNETEKKDIQPEIIAKKEEVKKPDPVKTKKPFAFTGDEEEEDAVTGISHKLQTEKTTLADKIGGKKVHDLRSAFDLNDKFYFIRELFRGDHNAFDKAIRYINSLTSYDDAKFYVQKELATNYDWKNTDSVEKLLDVVKVKFA